MPTEKDLQIAVAQFLYSYQSNTTAHAVAKTLSIIASGQHCCEATARDFHRIFGPLCDRPATQNHSAAVRKAREAMADVVRDRLHFKYLAAELRAICPPNDTENGKTAKAIIDVLEAAIPAASADLEGKNFDYGVRKVCEAAVKYAQSVNAMRCSILIDPSAYANGFRLTTSRDWRFFSASTLHDLYDKIVAATSSHDLEAKLNAMEAARANAMEAGVKHKAADDEYIAAVRAYREAGGTT